MAGSKKVTVVLPDALLRQAQNATGQGITPTIRQGLQLIAARDVYRKLRALRGKIDLELDVPALRDDRR